VSLPFRQAVRRLVVGDHAIAFGEQARHEGAHLRRVAAPAVREQHRRRIQRSPAPGGEAAAAILDITGVRVEEIEERALRQLRRGRGEEQSFGERRRVLGQEQRAGKKANVRAYSVQFMGQMHGDSFSIWKLRAVSRGVKNPYDVQ
jgi:hypothetical protein